MGSVTKPEAQLRQYYAWGSSVDILEHEKSTCCSPSTVSGYKNGIV